MKAIKRLMALLMAMAMIITLISGCGKVATKQAETSKQPEQTKENLKPVTVEFWSFARWNGIKGDEPDGKTGDWEMDAAKRFMNKNPHVKVDTQIIDSKSGPQKLSIAVAAGSGPDVLEDASNRMYDYANLGYILPLDGFVSKEDLADFEEAAWEMTSIGDGKHYFFPWGAAPQMILVNKTLFKQAGAEGLLPKNKERNWTRSEFIAALKGATSKLEDVYGLGLFGDTSTGDSFLLNFLWAGGVDTFDSNNTKFALNNEKGINGMKFIKELIDQKLINPGAAGLKAPDVITLFEQQKVLACSAATINYARTIKSMADGKLPKFEIETYNYPTADGAKPATFLHSYGFGVFANKDAYEQEWSVKLAEFLASKENAAAVKSASSFSLRKSQTGLYADSQDENIKFASSIVKNAVSGGIAMPGYSQIRNEWTPSMQKFMLGKLSPEEALKEMEANTNKKIAEMKKTLDEQKKAKTN